MTLEQMATIVIWQSREQRWCGITFKFGCEGIRIPKELPSDLKGCLYSLQVVGPFGIMALKIITDLEFCLIHPSLQHLFTV